MFYVIRSVYSSLHLSLGAPSCCHALDTHDRREGGCASGCADDCCGSSDAKKAAGSGGTCGDACCGDETSGKTGKATASSDEKGNDRHCHGAADHGLTQSEPLSVLAAASGAVADGRLLTCGSIVLSSCALECTDHSNGCLQVFRDSDEWQYQRVGDEVGAVRVRC